MNGKLLPRIELLKELLRTHSLDALLVYGDRHQPGYLRWALGGPSTSSGTYIVIQNSDVRILELAYRLPTWDYLSAIELIPVPDEDLYPDVLALYLHQARSIGIIGPAPAIHLSQLGQCTIIDMVRLCPDLTSSKNELEIQEISQLAQATSRLLSDITTLIQPDVREVDVARHLRSRSALVAERLAFPPSVLSGNRLRVGTVGAPSERALNRGDAVLIDIGLSNGGITTDITRMFFVENSPLQEPYQALEASTRFVAQTLTPGISLQEVLSMMKRALRTHGLPENSLEVADLGHGIGFALHEYPMLVRDSNQEVRLQAGMVLTLEPEITIDDFKLRVEEMVLITPQGSAILTR